MRFLFLCLFFIVSFNSRLFAFTLVSSPPTKFSNPEITINVAGNSCATSGISVDILLDSLELAVDTFWNVVPTSAINLKRGSILSTDVSTDTCTQIIAKAEDETILVGCSDGTSYADNPFASGWVAGAGRIESSGGVTRGAVILNNLTPNKIGNMSESELLTLLAHEIGHAIGLGHSEDPVAVMYYTIGGKTQESSTQDDYDAVTYLYPQEKEMGGLLGSCGIVAILNGGDGPGSGPGPWGGLFCMIVGFFIVLVLGGKNINIHFFKKVENCG